MTETKTLRATLQATMAVTRDEQMQQMMDVLNCRNNDFWEGFPPEHLLIRHFVWNHLPDGKVEAVIELEIRPESDGATMAVVGHDGVRTWQVFPHVRYGAPVDFAELGLVLVRPRQPIP